MSTKVMAEVIMMEMNVTSALCKMRQSGEAGSSGGGRSVSDGGGGDNGGDRNGGRRKDDGADKDDGEGADVRGSDDSGGACGDSYPVELEAGRMTVQVLGRRHTVLVVEKDMLVEAESELIVDSLLQCWQGR